MCGGDTLIALAVVPASPQGCHLLSRVVVPVNVITPLVPFDRIYFWTVLCLKIEVRIRLLRFFMGAYCRLIFSTFFQNSAGKKLKETQNSSNFLQKLNLHKFKNSNSRQLLGNHQKVTSKKITYCCGHIHCGFTS